jgi:endonuclease/exonuclease/phosphatase (EEP) superfamily protein YafD
MTPRASRWANALAAGYLLTLLLVVVAMRFVGERFWVTTLLLYLPRIGFLVPMPVLALLYLWTRQPLRAVGFVVLASAFVWFPLMGYSFGSAAPAQPGQIRVMTWNSYYGRVNNAAIRDLVSTENPDIFVGQATAHRTKELFRNNPGDYHLENDQEFFLATRFPVVEKESFSDLPDHYGEYHANFVRYTLQTPKGLIDVISMHPKSPRTGVDRLRGIGLRTRIAQGDIPEDAAPVDENTDLRQRQVDDTAAAARAAKHPVIVAGDTNLPTHSWLFARSFGQLQDAWAETSSGFGYTFPAKRPWLRIDRILADTHFRFLHSHVGPQIASDHHYLVADLALETPQ